MLALVLVLELGLRLVLRWRLEVGLPGGWRLDMLLRLVLELVCSWRLPLKLVLLLLRLVLDLLCGSLR